MTEADPYRVLEVEPEAGHDAIASAYRRLARQYHPDLSPDPESQDRMVAINQAWELLRDPVRRAAVDRARARSASTTARVAAADAQSHTAGYPPPGTRTDQAAGSYSRRPQAQSGTPAGQERPFGSMSEPADRGAEPIDHGSSRVGAAGPPPGRPSGSALNFGRFEGWTLGEIARVDPEYLEWLSRMPIGRPYQAEIDLLLRLHGRRGNVTPAPKRPGGLFRRG